MMGAPHAPSLLDVEVTHTLRGLLVGGKLSLGLAERARADLPQLGVAPSPGRRPPAARVGDAQRVHRVRLPLRRPGRGTGRSVLTRDGRLARGVADLVDLVEPDEA